jgi:hypothetical protein
MCGVLTMHIQYKGNVPWVNDRSLLIDIDKLPHGPSWSTEELLIGEGTEERVHILYKRSVIDLIRDLISEPSFKDCMRYALQRHWTSRARRERVYSETWTGNWWWRRQVSTKNP